MLVLLALGTFSVGGCDRTHGDASGRGDSGTPAEVKLGYFANLTHAQAVLGVSSGDFEKAVAPSKLVTRVFNAGPSLIEALNAGEVDIAYVGPGPALSAHEKSRGQSIRVIAGAAANGVAIVVRKDSGITSLDQLKGRKLATPQHGNTQDIAARHFVKSRFGDSELTNVLPIANAEQAGMMKRGDIDAAWVPEPWGERLIVETGATLLAEEKDLKDLWPDGRFTLTVVATTPRFLKEHPEIVERVLGVHRTWTQRLRTQPDAHVQPLGDALFALLNKRLPEGVLPAALKRVEFTDEPIEASFTTMAQWTHELGFARQPIALDGLIDLTVLERLEARDGSDAR